jgi:hypothetical protein
VLLPAEVLPFLSHDDPSLRQFASHYLGEAHDPWPVTADDVWAAMDRIPREERAWLAKYLGSYPLTPRSTERVFETLAGPVDDDDVWYHVAGRLYDHPLEDIRRAFAHPVIGERIARTETGRELLRRGMLCHPQQAAACALEVLRRRAPQDGRASWTLVLVVLLLQKLRVPEALGPLCDVAADPHPYFLFTAEWAADALLHLGTEEVIAVVAARYEDGALHRWGPRVLGRIKRPEAERALIDLFLAERRIEEGSVLAMALCELCSAAPEVIGTLRDMAEHELFDPHHGDLDDHLLVVCAMHGWEPAGAPFWRRRLAERRAARESPTAPSPSLATVRRAGKA